MFEMGKTVTIKYAFVFQIVCLRVACNKVSFEYPKPPISFIVIANDKYITDRCHIQDISSRFMDIQCH